MRNAYWLALVVGVMVASVAVPAIGDGDPTKGAKGKLFGTAKEDADPQNGANPVVSFDTDPNAVAGVERKLQKDVKVPSIDNQLETKYYFVDRGCDGSSPRFELQIDGDGDGKWNQTAGGPDQNAFGYIGDKAFGGGCPEDTWVYEDMTNDAPKWDLTQWGGGFTNTWDQVETFFTTNYPNHQVQGVRLIHDQSFAGDGEGCAYFDLTSLSDKTIDGHEDVAGGGEGKKANDC